MSWKGAFAVDEVSIPSRDESRNSFKEFVAIYGAPAYIRRAREVEAAFEQVLHRCRNQREEWLPMVRLRLGTLRALAGEWNALQPLIASDEDRRGLESLHDELKPTLRIPLQPTTSQRRLRSALGELRESLELFNKRWQAFLLALDLSRVNELRDGYNRFYLLEKECALRSPRLAREGYRRLEPLTVADVLAVFPPLPVPK